jgi:two-component system LytT family sensor kinase
MRRIILASREDPQALDVALGVLVGMVLTASAIAVGRLLSGPRRVLAPGEEAMRSALHAATATLPHLRRGLTRESAEKSVGHLRSLTQARGVAIADTDAILARAGEAPAAGAPLPDWLDLRRDDRVQVQPRLPETLGGAVAAPVMVQGRRIGTLIATYGSDGRVRPEDVRVVSEVASLVGAQVELSAVALQEERLARAELRALRAQISPHFIYNALAAVASYIHTRPEEARELLTEFADFTRYAFRGDASYVTLADELQYVEKYLRLEQARFGERLQVRVSVAPEVLAAVVPVLSLQPLVENAVRHGVESAAGSCRLEILGADLDADVELAVRDSGAGMDAQRAAAALAGRAGGIGLANVHARLRSTFGADYGLTVESRPGAGTTVRMLVPKFRAGVRAA